LFFKRFFQMARKLIKKKKVAAKKRKAARPKPIPPAKVNYDQHRESMAAKSRQKSEAGREIGPLPEVQNPARRARGLASLAAFEREYFPHRFFLPDGPPHARATERLEKCTDAGGLFAVTIMRGSGKTTKAEVAAIRAVLSGKRRFVVIVQATEKLAAKSLKKVQRELEDNEALLADFPEAVFPIRALKRIHHRANGQTLNGEPTRIEWTKEGVTFPTIAGSPSSGAMIYVVGITGSIKGLSAPDPITGGIMRPDFIIIDDCQTRKSAKSPVMTAELEATVMDDLLNLAGPTVKIAGVFLCTPMYPNDLTERFLDHERHPEWGGVRSAMLEAFPQRMDLWDQYFEIRKDSLRVGGDGAQATAFYRAKREAMDAGAVLAWPDRKFEDELSGLQHAMNLYYRSPRSFMAEYNCRPDEGVAAADGKAMIPAELAKRLNGTERLKVPPDCSLLTIGIDPGVWAVWYTVAAWNEHFGGAVVDVGCWPPQSRSQFAADDCRPSLRETYPDHTDAQLAFKSLQALTAEVLPRIYYHAQTGGPMKIERCLIDAGWQTDAVFQFARQSPFSTIITPSKGIGRTPTTRGVVEWQPRPGERKGPAWRLTKAEGGRGQQCQFDPDFWKSELHSKLTVPQGGMNALTLWGKSSGALEMLADHLSSETSRPKNIRGMTFDAWTKTPGTDNHWLDTTVLAAVGASVNGLRANFDPTTSPARPKKRKAISLSELAAQNRKRVA